MLLSLSITLLKWKFHLKIIYSQYTISFNIKYLLNSKWHVHEFVNQNNCLCDRFGRQHAKYAVVICLACFLYCSIWFNIVLTLCCLRKSGVLLLLVSSSSLLLSSSSSSSSLHRCACLEWTSWWGFVLYNSKINLSFYRCKVST